MPAGTSSLFPGTTVEANVSLPDEAGDRLIECVVHHSYAAPENEAWLYRRSQRSADGGGDSVEQPVFHTIRWELTPFSLPAGPQVLAGVSTVTASFLPLSDPEPRRIFLFLHIEP